MLLPWTRPAWERLQARRAGDRLPHALLLAGAAGLGKRAFAHALAQSMLCERLAPDGLACGECRACRLVAAGTHPDLAQITLEPRDDAEGKLRTEITIDQMRRLSERLTLTAQFGGAQVAVIDPADTLNVAAANALLKTLEEPTAGTLLLLVADHPARLPPTIRSRCQRIDFRVPPAREALAWLRSEQVDAAQADEALRASEGNPGLALAWLRDGAMTVRAEVAKDLGLVAAGAASAYDVALRWSRADPDLRLRFAAALVGQQATAQATDGARGPLALTTAIELPKLTAWFERANRTREWLRGPLRADLALIDLLDAWADSARGGRPARAAS